MSFTVFETEDPRFVMQIIMVIINRFINYPNINLTLTPNTVNSDKKIKTWATLAREG